VLILKGFGNAGKWRGNIGLGTGNTSLERTGRGSDSINTEQDSMKVHCVSITLWIAFVPVETTGMQRAQMEREDVERLGVVGLMYGDQGMGLGRRNRKS